MGNAADFRPANTRVLKRWRTTAVLSLPMVLVFLVVGWLVTASVNAMAGPVLPEGVALRPAAGDPPQVGLGRVTWHASDARDSAPVQGADGQYSFPAGQTGVPGLVAGASVADQTAAVGAALKRKVVPFQTLGLRLSTTAQGKGELSVLRTALHAGDSPVATKVSGVWPTSVQEALVTPSGVARGVPTSGTVTLVSRSGQETTVTIVGEGSAKELDRPADVITGIDPMTGPLTPESSPASAQWAVVDPTPIPLSTVNELAAQGMTVRTPDFPLGVNTASDYAPTFDDTTSVTEQVMTFVLLPLTLPFLSGYFVFLDTVLPCVLLVVGLSALLVGTRRSLKTTAGQMRDAVLLAALIATPVLTAFSWWQGKSLATSAEWTPVAPLGFWLGTSLCLWLIGMCAGWLRRAGDVAFTPGKLRLALAATLAALGTGAVLLGTMTPGMFGFIRVGQIVWLITALLAWPWVSRVVMKQQTMLPASSALGVVFVSCVGVTMLAPTSAQHWFAAESAGQGLMNSIVLFGSYSSYLFWIALLTVCLAVYARSGQAPKAGVGEPTGGSQVARLSWRMFAVASLGGITFGTFPAALLALLPTNEWSADDTVQIPVVGIAIVALMLIIVIPTVVTVVRQTTESTRNALS